MRLQFDEDVLRQVCLAYGIRRLALFGSVLREDFGPDSDVDVLVEFAPDVKVGLLRFIAVEEALESVFGRKVDLVTLDGPSPYLRAHVLRTCRVIYDDR